MSVKLLIIGGYGAFGGRLAQLLADQENLHIFIGGRTLLKAEQLCAELSGKGAVFTPIKLDKFNLPPTLSRYSPDIIIDASGPFNLKSENPYGVVKACLDFGIHYLDLADGADFVMGIKQFDQRAKDKDTCVISGLSTCPALTGAILKEASQNMPVEKIEIGVAPSPFARMGLSVVKGIFDYAGDNITVYKDGQKTEDRALTNSRRKTIAPPGALPLRNRLFAFVDAPDLQIFPEANDSTTECWMGAGTRPEYLLRWLIRFAKLRALLRLPRSSWLAKPAHSLLNRLANGDHRGGLYLKASNSTESREWHILAEGDDGPFIPAIACAALISKWRISRPKSGARPADQTLDLDDFQPWFDQRNINYGWRIFLNTNYIFENVLSNDFNQLSEQFRALHAPDGPTIWKGCSVAEGPSNILGKLAGLVAGLNVKNGETETTVTITPTPKGEVWERNFGGRKFKSRLTPGTGKNEYMMMEHFGFLKFALALVHKDNRLYFIPRRWFFLGIPMPQFLLPKGESYETVEGGQFIFNVNLNVPLIGRVASYRGWLVKED